MTKILFADDLNIGFVDEFTSKTGTVKVQNIGTEKVVISDMISNSQYFVTDFTEETVQPKFPANSTIYINDLGRCQDLTTGEFYVTNQGYGILGTTDSDGLLTLNPGLPEVSITSPSEDAEYKVGSSVTITWTASNIENLDLVVESGSGLLTVEDIDASLGTYTFNLTADLGTFYPNDTISISLTDCLGIASDTVAIDTIATITITPAIGEQTAGVAFDVAGTANCSTVDILVGGSVVEADVAVTGGAFTQEITIADAADDVLIRVEDSDNENAYDTETIDVASGTMLTAFQFGGSTEVGETANFTVPLGVKIVGKYIYVGGYTRSTKILGQTTGSNGSITYAYYAKFDLQYNLQWIKFYEYRYMANATPNFVIVGDYIFVLDCVYNAGDYNTTVRKLALSDGTLVASRLLSNVSGDGFGTCIDYYNSNIYVGGGSNEFPYKMTLWTLPLDLSTDSKANYNNAGTASSNGDIRGLTMLGDGNFAIAHSASENVQIFTIGTENNIGNYTSAGQDQNGNYSKSATRFLALTFATTGAFKFDMRAYSGINNSIYSETYSSNNNARIGMSRWDGSKFLALYNDEAKFYLASIADSNTYSKTAIAEHTPNAITAISCVTSGLDWSDDYYVIAGTIIGKMEADSVSSGYSDTFIKIIEK